MRIKLILLITMLSILAVACSDDKPTEPIAPKPIPPKRLFEAELGMSWNFRKGTEQAFLRVLAIDSADWAFEYWELSKRNRLKTYLVEWREFDNGFPRYTDYALAETDSGYFFGTFKHFLVSPDYPTDFAVLLFFIPDSVANGRIENRETTKQVLGEERYWKYSARWNFEGMKNFDTLRPNWKITYFAEQKTPVVSKMGEELEIMEHIGFYKFRNYTLESINKD